MKDGNSFSFLPFLCPSEMMAYMHSLVLIGGNWSKASQKGEIIFRLLKTQAVSLVDHKFLWSGNSQERNKFKVFLQRQDYWPDALSLQMFWRHKRDTEVAQSSWIRKDHGFVCVWASPVWADSQTVVPPWVVEPWHLPGGAQSFWNIHNPGRMRAHIQH